MLKDGKIGWILVMSHQELENIILPEKEGGFYLLKLLNRQLIHLLLGTDALSTMMRSKGGNYG